MHLRLPERVGTEDHQTRRSVRPRSIPVLDGHLALAFGFGRAAFSEAAVQRSLTREERIDRVVCALAHAVSAHTAGRLPSYGHVRNGSRQSSD